MPEKFKDTFGSQAFLIKIFSRSHFVPKAQKILKEKRMVVNPSVLFLCCRYIRVKKILVIIIYSKFELVT